MRNLFLSLAFDGGAYHGWQSQQNAKTVQDTLEKALAKLSGTRERVTGCSRTDAGVHAAIFCCSVHTELALPMDTVVAALSGNLPRDIVVLSCREVPEDFHARYDCLAKEYRYRIWNGARRNPFLEGRALQYPYPLDAELLHAQAGMFVGTHDFRAFCAAGGSVSNTVRTVDYARVERRGSELVFSVQADGFLYHMVRIMAGTLLYIAQGKREAGSIPEILVSGKREKAGYTAPAQGLYLTKVVYPDRIYQADGGWGT